MSSLIPLFAPFFEQLQPLVKSASFCYNSLMHMTFASRFRAACGWLTMCLLASFALLMTYAFVPNANIPVEARLLPKHLRGASPWKTITAEEVIGGAVVPADTNVIIHLPEDMPPTTRRTLFGRMGQRARYWGYRFPESYDEASRLRRRYGLPGLLFLSEKERAYMRAVRDKQLDENFSVFKNLNDRDLNRSGGVRGRIRHQVEILKGGQTLYVMTELPLPVGIDADGDGANSRVEHDNDSDPQNRDTDGDGVTDGREIFGLGSNPVMRDTDGDGLIDGIEDANRNGRRDVGETYVTEWDSDRDGLCDGLCKVDKGRRLAGEDRNLNGKYEPEDDETNPLSVDSDDDGILDEQEFLNCELKGGKNCGFE